METTQLDTPASISPGLIYIKDEADLEVDEMDLHPNDRPGKWFIVQTMSGAEKRVQANLSEMIDTGDRSQGAVFEVAVPEEEVIEIRQNKKVARTRKMFAGYVFVRCDIKKQSWSAIRDTPGVVGFAGQATPAEEPQPMSKNEVDKFLNFDKNQPLARSRPRSTYDIGDQISIKAGPFAEFSGQIIEVNEEQFKVKVLVDLFGRETSVELEFSQVAKT